MPKSELSRSMSVEERKRNRALRETLEDLTKSSGMEERGNEIAKGIREQNVRMIDIDTATRSIMKNAGPGAKRPTRITRSVLSQRKPGGSD